MIKGKKIEPVSLQLLSTNKNVQKQGGFAVGKEFMLEKKDILTVKDKKQYQNEQEVAQTSKQQVQTLLKNEKPKVQCNQSIDSAKIINKNVNASDLKGTKVNDKVTKIEKTSKERQPAKKQNRMLNDKTTKPAKNDGLKEETLLKNIKKQQKKSYSAEISNQTHKKITTTIGNRTLDKQNSHFPPQLIQQNQAIQLLNQSQEEVEQEERVQTPHPIIESNIEPDKDYLSQISFGNHQQEMRMPTNPLKYQSSDEEECIADNYFCTTRNEDDLMSEKNNSQISLDSQLFSLTAEQLLAKEYFNI